jgi:hypothetical protein
MTRLLPTTLALSLAFPAVAYAQASTPLPGTSPAFQLPAAAAAPAGAPTMKLSGYDRIRWVSKLNHDLNTAAVTDNWYSFSDIRSYLTLETAWDQWKIVSSVDLAGTDFDEGGLMGFDHAPRQRPFNLSVRHLFLDYKNPELGLSAQLGRQPARLGFGLVSAINRDSFKLAQNLPDTLGLTKSNLTGVWVRGAKGLTQHADHLPQPTAYVTTAPGVSGTYATNDPNGQPHELNTYVLAFNTVPLPNHRLQAFYAHQADFSQPGLFPQKRYADLNVEGTFGAFKYGGEAVALFGQSPTAAATGARQELNSFATLLTGTYTLGNMDIGFTAGRGGGDVDAKDTVNNGFQSLFLDETAFAYNHLFGDDLHGFNGTDASIGFGAGLNNVTFLQPSLAYRFTPDLNASLSYTRHLTTAPVYSGSGVLGRTPTASTALVSAIGDELDARVSYKLGVATIYGAASTFAPGDVFANSGLGNAASKLEVGTEVRF